MSGSSICVRAPLLQIRLVAMFRVLESGLQAGDGFVLCPIGPENANARRLSRFKLAGQPADT